MPIRSLVALAAVLGAVSACSPQPAANDVNATNTPAANAPTQSSMDAFKNQYEAQMNQAADQQAAATNAEAQTAMNGVAPSDAITKAATAQGKPK